VHAPPSDPQAAGEGAALRDVAAGGWVAIVGITRALVVLEACAALHSFL
jgi:hypothetical protein